MERYNIGFGTNNTFKAKLLRWLFQSDWSHVWVEYYIDDFIYPRVTHASDEGLVQEGLPAVIARYPKYQRFHVNRDLNEGLELQRKSLGSPYDYKTVIWNGLILLVLRLASLISFRVRKEKWMKLARRNKNLFSCTEFVTQVLQESRVPGTAQMDSELVTPKDLEQLCLSNEKLFRRLR